MTNAVHVFRLDDAAYAGNLPTGAAAKAGYYGGPNAFHTWPDHAWAGISGGRLPIWVAGGDHRAEAPAAIDALKRIGVPPHGGPDGNGLITALDMESRTSDFYVDGFGAELNKAGYRVLVYGSEDTVFDLPQLNGRWVAAWSMNPQQVLTMPGVRLVQYAADLPPGYDASLGKRWILDYLWTA